MIGLTIMNLNDTMDINILPRITDPATVKSCISGIYRCPQMFKAKDIVINIQNPDSGLHILSSNCLNE